MSDPVIAPRVSFVGRAGSLLSAIRPFARDAFPVVLVATIIPLGLFYVALATASVLVAIGVSVAYAYGVAVYQYWRRRRVSGMLLVTMFMVTVRAIAVVVSGQPIVYFAVPVLKTAGFGLMFLASMFSSEPLVVRLARDFVPHVASDLATRRELIRALSLVWSLTYLASGATTLTLLVTQSLPVYMGAHQLTGWCWTGSGVVATVLVCRWRARSLFVSALQVRPAA